MLPHHGNTRSGIERGTSEVIREPSERIHCASASLIERYQRIVHQVSINPYHQLLSRVQKQLTRPNDSQPEYYTPSTENERSGDSRDLGSSAIKDSAHGQSGNLISD